MGIKLRTLWPPIEPYADYALRLAGYYGLHPVITSVTRTWSKQAALRSNWDECRARGLYPSDVSINPGMSCRWPANRPGDSAHNFGLAWDSWVPDAEMPTWVGIREALGWHVPAHDAIHAELPQWREWVKAGIVKALV